MIPPCLAPIYPPLRGWDANYDDMSQVVNLVIAIEGMPIGGDEAPQESWVSE